MSIPALYKSVSLFTSLRTDRIHLQAEGRNRQPNLALVFLCLFCVIVYFVACLLLLLDLVFQYQAHRLVEKNVSEMTYLFVLDGT